MACVKYQKKRGFNDKKDNISFKHLGFANGYVHWDDEDSGNRNDLGGTLPDGKYDDGNTEIQYCCR